MKAGNLPFVLVILFGGLVSGRAQQAATNTLGAGTNAAPGQPVAAAALRQPAGGGLQLTEPKDTNSLEYLVAEKTTLRISGPLIQPLKAKNPSDLSHRVFHLISPFAKEKPKWQTAPTGPVNTRAWNTIVGWNPGRSAFPDDKWLEPSRLDLISVNVEKQP